jgi:hypothetical protein
MEEILWFVSRACGLVSLLLLTGTVVLGCAHATRASAGGWRRFTLHALHRNVSLLAVVFLAVHIGSAIIDGYVPLQWIDAVIPFVSDYHPVWLGLGALAFVRSYTCQAIATVVNWVPMLDRPSPSQ